MYPSQPGRKGEGGVRRGREVGERRRREGEKEKNRMEGGFGRTRESDRVPVYCLG